MNISDITENTEEQDPGSWHNTIRIRRRATIVSVEVRYGSCEGKDRPWLAQEIALCKIYGATCKAG
jgi:hypothetical protein